MEVVFCLVLSRTTSLFSFQLALDLRDNFLRRSGTPAIISERLPHISVDTIYASRALSDADGRKSDLLICNLSDHLALD